jgi:hypothetical protein
VRVSPRCSDARTDGPIKSAHAARSLIPHLTIDAVAARPERRPLLFAVCVGWCALPRPWKPWTLQTRCPQFPDFPV